MRTVGFLYNRNSGYLACARQPADFSAILRPVRDLHGGASTAFDRAAVSATFESPTFPVPAPAGIALFLAGLLGLRFARR